MSDQQPAANPEPGQQGAGTAAEGLGGEIFRTWYGAVVEPRRLDREQRRMMIIIGGLLAGLCFGIGLAIVIHMIEQVNPGAFPNGVGQLVVVMLVVIGPLFGLGLGLMAGGLLPDETRRQGQPPVR